MKIILIILGIILLLIFLLFIVCSCIVANRVDRLEDEYYER